MSNLEIFSRRHNKTRLLIKATRIELAQHYLIVTFRSKDKCLQLSKLAVNPKEMEKVVLTVQFKNRS